MNAAPAVSMTQASDFVSSVQEIPLTHICESKSNPRRQLDEKNHIVPVKTYVGVFVALMLLAAMITGLAYVHMGVGNTVTALVIAVIKKSSWCFFYARFLRPWADASCFRRWPSVARDSHRALGNGCFHAPLDAHPSGLGPGYFLAAEMKIMNALTSRAIAIVLSTACLPFVLALHPTRPRQTFTASRFTSMRATQTKPASPSVQQSEIERGHYLLEQVAMCCECHTPRDKSGNLDVAQWLQGATIWINPVHEVNNWAEWAPRLAGLPSFTDDQAEQILEKGIGPNGAPIRPPMHIYHMSHPTPWPSSRIFALCVNRPPLACRHNNFRIFESPAFAIAQTAESAILRIFAS